MCFFFFSSRRRHTSFSRDWSSDVCSSDLFVLLDKLPTTPSGRIDRRKLPLPAMEPRTDLTDEPLLERLRAVWCELLGLNELRPQTNVFDVGARSLLVMRCVARLKELGIRLSVADIYDRPTLAGMAQVIERSEEHTSELQ